MSVHAYDVLENVAVTITVREYDDYDLDENEIVLRAEATIRSKGEADPRLWARDALVGLLELL